MGDDSTSPCELLPWEAEIFGLTVARVRGDRLTPGRVAEIDDWCAAQGVAWLFFAGRSDDAATVRCAEDAGFRLVEVRVTLERSLASFAPAAVDPMIRPYAER